MAPSQDRVLFVSLEENGERITIGKIFFHGYGDALSTTFIYDEDWLSGKMSFPIAPYMPLVQQHYNTVGIPGFASDAAPDRWGRMLIYKGIAQESSDMNQTLRIIDEYDYLAGVDDWARMGAWRFSETKDGPFVAQQSNIPKLITLPELLSASHAVLHENQESYAGIKLLLSAGTSSLGGAHPKATVEDGGVLYLAKFPNINETWDDVRWESFCLSMARKCGITTPDYRVINIGDFPVLLVRRFDREAEKRIPYMSALSLLQLADNARADYADLAEVARTFVANPREEMKELFTRTILNIVLHNIDDHARNHGFIRTDEGWTLSPVFDLTVSPFAAAERRMAVFGRTGSNETEGLSELAELFGLSNAERNECVEKLMSAFVTWRIEAQKAACKESEIAVMKPIFEDRLSAVKKAMLR